MATVQTNNVVNSTLHEVIVSRYETEGNVFGRFFQIIQVSLWLF